MDEEQSDEGRIIKIYAGEEGQSFQVGNFLNALDELVCWFQAHDTASGEMIPDALELYARYLREG